MEANHLVGKIEIDEELLKKDILDMLNGLGLNPKLKGYRFIAKMVFIRLLNNLQGEECTPIRTLARDFEKQYNNGIQIESAMKYTIKDAWNNEELRNIYNNQKPGIATIVNNLAREFYKRNIVVTYTKENNHKIFRL